mgnify:CR=1 FL=1
MNELYRGYVKLKGKASVEKFKGVPSSKLRTLEEAQKCDEYGGVLAKNTMFIDIDDSEQAEILMNIVEEYQLDCKVICTTRGKHFIFKNSKVTRCYTHVSLAIGLTADIKTGFKDSYEKLKADGEERFCEWDIEEGGKYQEVPKWLFPVKATADFVDMDAGDGRNQALFNYILTLTANDFTVEETRECIRILNKFVLKQPLSDDELEVILRDDAFQKPVFFLGSTFLFDKFANYMINNHHIVKINGQLHIYKDGIYCSDLNVIAGVMRSYIPNIKKSQKTEVIDYMYDMTEEKELSDARYIGFNNGVYDVVDDTLNAFSPEYVITNKIPWDYKPDAYSELADSTLNKLACGDAAIRALLEECIGYCFYRANTFNKAFILTGDKSNGKSTFLKVLTVLLGEHNVASLDLKNLGDRFSKASLFGKLANIGDDISDEFVPDASLFKKITDGGRIQVEKKGQDPFEFNPYVKLIFSANDIPRIRDKTGAVLRRLVIIPFNARFSESDADYNPNIKSDLTQDTSIEYLIMLGCQGLKRLLATQKFTISQKVEEERQAYNIENNPILAFIEEVGKEGIVNEPTNEVYKRYQVFCAENNYQPTSNIVFSKSINKTLELKTVTGHIMVGKQRKSVKIFTE